MSTADYLSDEDELPTEKEKSIDTNQNSAKDLDEKDINASEELEAVKFLEVLVPKESLVRKRAFSALLRQIVER